MSSIAFISDIHANLPALNAVLADIAARGITEIYCLGDIVGYGGCPGECLEVLRTAEIPCLMGNHDFTVTRHNTAGHGRTMMGQMWDWTEQALSDEQRAWLAALPLTLQGPDFECVHAMLPHPLEWGYVIHSHDAQRHFAHQRQPLALIGHTHRPALWREGDRESLPISPDVAVTLCPKQLANVGSVGQPRDGDPRACYLIYDRDLQQLLWRRLPYDLLAAQHAIEDAGLPLAFAHRLTSGR